MKRRPKSPGSEEKSSMPAAEDASAILQVKVWLTGISPRCGGRILVPTEFTLREPRDVIHEVRIEDWLEPDARKTYPVCATGDGVYPP
jgi:hypothetical protein